MLAITSMVVIKIERVLFEKTNGMLRILSVELFVQKAELSLHEVVALIMLRFILLLGTFLLIRGGLDRFLVLVFFLHF